MSQVRLECDVRFQISCAYRLSLVAGTAAYDRVHPELLEAIGAGKIAGLEDLITSKIALEDVVEKGFRALLENRDAHGSSTSMS